MRITVSFYGEGIRFWICDLHHNTYSLLEEACKEHDAPLDMLLFDLDFLKKMGLSSWEELATHEIKRNFLFSPLSRLEIKKENKFLLRIPSSELLPGNTLFPIYNTMMSPFNIEPVAKDRHRLILYQNETGLFYKFCFETSVFNIDQLTFNITPSLPFVQKPTISGICYENSKIIQLNEDTLTRSSRVYKE
jgi:hypothetical protein